MPARLTLFNYGRRSKRFNALFVSFKRTLSDCSKQSLLYVFRPGDNMIVFPVWYKRVDNLQVFKVKSVYGGSARRPELTGSPVYDGISSLRYSESDRVFRIQTELTQKALDLLNHVRCKSANKCVLDIGCGSGISASVLEKAGYFVIGTDRSKLMLNLFSSSYNTRDGVLLNMSHCLPFRSNSFGTVVSISALQWLFVSYESRRHLRGLFSSIYNCLDSEGQAVIQFYPRNIYDVEAVVDVSQEYFNNGALVGDYPHSHRGKKLFLLLIKR